MLNKYDLNENMRYDSDEKTAWIYRRYSDHDAIVPLDETAAWSERLRRALTDDGEPLLHVNYVFADRRTARVNHDKLAFNHIGTYVGDLDSNTPYDDEEPEFDVREDYLAG